MPRCTACPCPPAIAAATSSGNGSSPPIAGIAGGVVAGVVAVITAVVLAIWLRRRKQSRAPAVVQKRAGGGDSAPTAPVGNGGSLHPCAVGALVQVNSLWSPHGSSGLQGAPTLPLPPAMTDQGARPWETPSWFMNQKLTATAAGTAQPLPHAAQIGLNGADNRRAAVPLGGMPADWAVGGAGMAGASTAASSNANTSKEGGRSIGPHSSPAPALGAGMTGPAVTGTSGSSRGLRDGSNTGVSAVPSQVRRGWEMDTWQEKAARHKCLSELLTSSRFGFGQVYAHTSLGVWTKSPKAGHRPRPASVCALPAPRQVALSPAQTGVPADLGNLIIPWSEIAVGSLLGEGGFGKVVKGTWRVRWRFASEYSAMCIMVHGGRQVQTTSFGCISRLFAR
jgi:hypothetical protein